MQGRAVCPVVSRGLPARRLPSSLVPKLHLGTPLSGQLDCLCLQTKFNFADKGIPKCNLGTREIASHRAIVPKTAGKQLRLDFNRTSNAAPPVLPARRLPSITHTLHVRLFRLPVPAHRRAHQRHRLASFRQAHPGGRLRDRPPGRAPAGRGRGQRPRREHGRGHARRREGHGALSQPPVRRAGHRARSYHGRFLQVERHRGGTEVSARQGNRQQHLAQGRRGKVQALRQADPPVRRGGGGDGLRRGRAGRQLRTPGRNLHARLPHPDRGSRLPRRGHHLRSQHPHGRHRHRGAQQLRGRFHRGHPLDSHPPARGPRLRRRVEHLVFLPRQHPRARGDALGVPLPRHSRGHGHGHRQRGRAGGVRGHRQRPAGARGGRAAQPPRGRHRAAGGSRRGHQGAEVGRQGQDRQGGRGVAARHGGGTAFPRAGQGHRGPHRRRHRGGAPEVRPSVAGH